MPKIKCKCDHVIPLGEIPSPHQLMIISDVEYDQFQGSVDAEEIYMAMDIVVKCPNCQRLHVFWDGFSNLPEVYKLEE